MFDSKKLFDSKKKKPVAMVLAMKGKTDPEEPDALEKPTPIRRPQPDVSQSADEETAETPAEEGNEEYGAKLIADIEAVGEKHGMDAEQSRAIAGDLFGAMAECLRRGSEPDESESENYPT